MISRLIIMYLVSVLVVCTAACRAADDDAQSYYDHAYRLYMEEGQPRAQEIIQLLTNAIEADPEHIKAISLLGITYYGIGRFEEAIEQFDRYGKLNAGNISPKILLKKAISLHELGRHNESRRILSTMRALFQDSPKIKNEYDSYYPTIVEGARKDNLTTAYAVLQSQGVENLQDFIFFAIDEDNYDPAADDPDLEVMTLPHFGMTHGWMDVIALPMSDERGFAYCVNFDWDQALEFSHLDRLAAKDESIEEVREMVQGQRVQINPSTLPDMSGQSIAWLRGETTTVSGQNITAYRLAPYSPHE